MASPSPFVAWSGPLPSRVVAGTIYNSGQFTLVEAVLSWSWGLQAAQATCKYVGPTQITEGSAMVLTFGGHRFEGVCQSCLPELSTQGDIKTFVFRDYRKYLDDDVVFGQFNKLEHITVGSQRLRRYYHVYPSDIQSGLKTYTTNPLSGSQIISALLTAPTTESPWSIYHCHPTSGDKTAGYHPSLTSNPSYDLDFEHGTKLGVAIQQVLDQHGLVMTIGGKLMGANTSSAYDLIFARKGEGVLPDFDELSDNRRDGTVLSDVPTRVRVVGDRNRYQVHGIAMVPDWAGGWEMFFNEHLAAHIFQYMTLNVAIGSVPKGRRYNAISGDTYFVIGNQLAAARAMEITVGEFAEWRQAVFGDGDDFIDYRTFGGKTRMLMPAALYISLLVFRAFRLPDNFGFANMYRQNVSIAGAELSSDLIAYVTHDPATGQMFWDTTQAADGPGYAIVQGYIAGQDNFRTIHPDRFDLTQWTNSQNIWQAVNFQIDESGSPDGRFILFDEPVIRSGDLFNNGSNPADAEMNGFAMLRKNPTITVPEVRAALCFHAEKFVRTVGAGSKDEAVSVPGLHEEWMIDANGIQNNPYSDGLTAVQKADGIANAMLARQYSYKQGGFVRPMPRDEDGVYPDPTYLSGVVDRVTLRWSTQGLIEEVDFTSERNFMGFTPERDFDRAERDKGLYPGQKQLQEQANQLKVSASALSNDPKLVRLLHEAFYGAILDVPLKAGSSGTIKAGTPIWREEQKPVGSHTTTSADQNKVFAGVTVLDGVVAVPGKHLQVQEKGTAFARVKGPVAVNDPIGKSTDSGATHLAKNGTPAVGQVLQTISTAVVRLVPIRIGTSGGQTEWFQGEWSSTTAYSRGQGFKVSTGIGAGTYITLANAPAGALPWLGVYFAIIGNLTDQSNWY